MAATTKTTTILRENTYCEFCTKSSQVFYPFTFDVHDQPIDFACFYCVRTQSVDDLYRTCTSCNLRFLVRQSPGKRICPACDGLEDAQGDDSSSDDSSVSDRTYRLEHPDEEEVMKVYETPTERFSVECKNREYYNNMVYDINPHGKITKVKIYQKYCVLCDVKLPVSYNRRAVACKLCTARQVIEAKKRRKENNIVFV